MNEQSDLATAAAGATAINAPSDIAAPAKGNHGGGARAEVVINVRFQPNGLVNTINQRPDRLSPQEWFDFLCRAAPLAYQPLSGGRGAFRIASDDFDVVLRNLPA
jgi:hypothetical protein